MNESTNLLIYHDLILSIVIILHHHEYWNGKGYPDGLIGEKIPLGWRLAPQLTDSTA